MKPFYRKIVGLGIELQDCRSKGFIFPDAFRLTLVKGIVRIENLEVRSLIKRKNIKVKKRSKFLIGRKVSTNQKQKR